MTWHLSDRNKTNSISNCQRLGHIHALKRQIIPKCYLHLATFSVFPNFVSFIITLIVDITSPPCGLTRARDI